LIEPRSRKEHEEDQTPTALDLFLRDFCRSGKKFKPERCYSFCKIHDSRPDPKEVEGFPATLAPNDIVITGKGVTIASQR